MQKLPGLFGRERSSMRKLAEWLVDMFVHPNAVMHQSCDKCILTMDENSKRLNYAQLYKEFEEIRIEQRNLFIGSSNRNSNHWVGNSNIFMLNWTCGTKRLISTITQILC